MSEKRFIYMVTTNNGDGSNGVRWVLDQLVITKMEELADEGDGEYASGDGLQLHELYFPDGFDIEEWLKMNHLSVTEFEDVDREAY